MSRFTKDDFQTGMIGEVNKGELFVVVKGYLVYQDGTIDELEEFTDDFILTNSWGDYFVQINRVVTGCSSFDEYLRGEGELLYDRFAVRKVTYDEVKKALGYDFELID